MKIGLMTDRLVFLKEVSEQTPSGAIRKEWKEVFKCRAWRRKFNLTKMAEVAKEDFIGHMVIFRTWNYPVIDYDCRVKWGGLLWKVVLLEPEGRELTITLNKVDD